MFIPLYDGVALRYLKQPTATYILLALNIFVYLTTATGLVGDAQQLGLGLGMIPAVLFGSAVIDPAVAHVPTWATLITSLFLHGSFLHLVGNMLFLWVFGDNVEDAMGSLRFTVFYLLSGIAGSLLYAMLEQQSQAPLIGASGAVSGVVAAYVLLYPRVHVFVLAFAWLPLSITALYIILAWIAVQVGSALFSTDTTTGWWAHVGGLIAGAALTPLLRRPEVPLFGKRTA